MESKDMASASQFLEEPEKPQNLRILCILSFIGCGLMILIYGLGTLCLGMTEETIAKFWDQAVEKNPELENVDPMVLFHDLGMVSVYCLIATVFSLIGVIMMWKLERVGFYIYAVAELSTNFFSVNTGINEHKSYLGMIIFILLDLLFIVLYFTNLKYMNKKNNNTFIQSGG
jgi:hypothetical protein